MCPLHLSAAPPSVFSEALWRVVLGHMPRTQSPRLGKPRWVPQASLCLQTAPRPRRPAPQLWEPPHTRREVCHRARTGMSVSRSRRGAGGGRKGGKLLPLGLLKVTSEKKEPAAPPASTARSDAGAQGALRPSGQPCAALSPSSHGSLPPCCRFRPGNIRAASSDQNSCRESSRAVSAAAGTLQQPPANSPPDVRLEVLVFGGKSSELACPVRGVGGQRGLLSPEKHNKPNRTPKRTPAQQCEARFSVAAGKFWSKVRFVFATRSLRFCSVQQQRLLNPPFFL